MRAFSLVVTPGLLIAGAALAVEQGSWGARASAVAAPGLLGTCSAAVAAVAHGLRCARPRRVGA